MGIRAQDMAVELSGTKLEVTKHMLANPRRIGKIEIYLYLPGNIAEHNQKVLQQIGDNCPVVKSLHPDIELVVVYHWG